MAGTLYTYPDNFRAYKVLIAAQYSGADVKVVCEPPEFELGKTNKTEAFLQKFPLGKVPAFETTDGTAIFESNAIAYYVANAQLRGCSDIDAALVQQYVNFADHELLPAACTWTFPTLGIMQYNQQGTKQAQETVRRCLGFLDAVLSTRTFLVGERITLADITVACNLLLLFKQVLDPEFRAPYGNVNRWFLTCVNQPQFKEVLGEVQLCTKMANFDAKKYNELFPKEKKEKKEKAEKPKKEPQAKKEKPKPAAQEQEEQEEDSAPKPPKFKDPYVNLPKSPFDLDGFKRLYSNSKDILGEVMPWFWENLDRDGWSLWKAEYKFKEELKYVFMSSNLVSGMFQRLDKLHKYAFANVLIIGEDGDNDISGVWLLRGQELAFSLVEDWNIDAESYNFSKLDPESEEDRATVTKYFTWEGDFGGKEIADGKVFK